MDSYKLVRLYANIDQNIIIRSTHAQDLGIILADLKRIFPAAKVKSLQFPDGNVYGFDIEKLKNECDSAHWWVIQQLSKNGYEPFGTVQGGEYSFRIKA